jgi:hypothetical protein
MSFAVVTATILESVVGLYAADKALDIYKRYRNLMIDNKQRSIQFAGEAWNADKALKEKTPEAYSQMNGLPSYNPDLTVSQRAKISIFSTMRKTKESVVGRSSKSQLGFRDSMARGIMLPIAAASVSLMADARKHQFGLEEAYRQIKSRGIVGIASGGAYSGGVVSAFKSNANVLSDISAAYAQSFNGALATIGVGVGQILEITSRPRSSEQGEATSGVVFPDTPSTNSTFGPPV